jgi:hypothetical protein
MSSAAPSKPQLVQRPPVPIYRRYKWEDLTAPEQAAMRDALGIAGTRAGVGFGLVATLAAALTSGLLLSRLDAVIVQSRRILKGF